MRCEARTLDDIRALGGNDIEDERRFAAAAKLSEVNLALYRTYMQPMVKAAATPPVAEAIRNMHPLRLQYALFGPDNPFMAWTSALADLVRENREPADAGNPFIAWQEALSHQIVDGLDAYLPLIKDVLRPSPAHRSDHA